MRILILALNHAPEPIGAAVYTTGLARELASRGHHVEVVCAEPYYPAWRIFDGYANRWRTDVEDGVRIARCPLYVPAQPSGAKRVLHHLSFALAALVPTLARAIRTRPDAVWTVAPSLVAAPVAWAAARLTGAKAWLHVQDFEVGAAVATGLIPSTSLSARLARTVERTIMRRFDALSTISPAMVARAAGIVPRERITEFRNWADLDPAAPPPGDFRAEWGLGDRTVALYSGNLANKQGVEIIPEAARLLAHRDDIRFVVCGDGSARADFERAAATLTNILLKPLQDRADLPRLLATADLHLLPQRADAADLVLPSKLTNMLASGRATVATAAPGTGLHAEVAGCGLTTPPGDAPAFAAAIERLADDPALRQTYAAEARRRAAARWDRRAIIDRFERDLRALTNP